MQTLEDAWELRGWMNEARLTVNSLCVLILTTVRWWQTHKLQRREPSTEIRVIAHSHSMVEVTPETLCHSEMLPSLLVRFMELTDRWFPFQPSPESLGQGYIHASFAISGDIIKMAAKWSTLLEQCKHTNSSLHSLAPESPKLCFLFFFFNYELCSRIILMFGEK